MHLPGRDKRVHERPFDHLLSLVETLAEVLPYDKPFAFFGHSMGALVSFELARELRRRRRREPGYLFISAQAAPQIPIPPGLRNRMPDFELVQELRQSCGTPEEVLQDGSLMELLLSVLRADFSLVETYIFSPEEPLNCPIAVFGGEQDAEAGLEDLTAWRQQTSGAFALRRFPGGHFYLQEGRPNLLREIAKAMATLLESGSERQFIGMRRQPTQVG